MCDEKLQKVFKRKSMNMMKMNKLLSEHVKRVDQIVGGGQKEDEEDEGERPAKKRKTNTGKAKATTSKAKKGGKAKAKKGGGGFAAECQLSAPLQALLGKPTMARTAVVKELWVYIKAHNLQNPKDKR